MLALAGACLLGAAVLLARRNRARRPDAGRASSAEGRTRDASTERADRDRARELALQVVAAANRRDAAALRLLLCDPASAEDADLAGLVAGTEFSLARDPVLVAGGAHATIAVRVGRGTVELTLWLERSGEQNSGEQCSDARWCLLDAR